MERHKPSRKQEPEKQPVEPEMPKDLVEEEIDPAPASEPPKEKHTDNL